MKYCEEMISEITGYIKQGSTAKDASAIAGISEETFYAWKKEKPEFSESLERAKIQYKNSLIKRIEKVSEKNWRACAWLLERRFPDDFSPKLREKEGNDGQPKTLADIMLQLHYEKQREQGLKEEESTNV